MTAAARWRRLGPVLLLASLGAACASPPRESRLADGPEVRNADPVEPANRAIFGFNDGLDGFFFEPLGKAWAWVLPEAVRMRVGQVFTNLTFPSQLVNNLLQGEIKQAGVDVARFVTNSTVGLAGLFDPASRLGLNSRGEDFGQTLAVWGVPEGPYLMVPLVGPSGGRDLAALPVDLALNPWTYTPLRYSGPANAGQLVNARSLNLDRVRSAREAALDWYAFVRNAYRQQRVTAVANGNVEAEGPDEDLYELDEDE